MTKKQDDWGDLTSLWQEEQGIDPITLANSVRRKTWSMRFMFGLEMLASIFGAVFALWLIFRDQYPADMGLGIFLLGFSTFGVIGTVWVRKGAWVADSGGVNGQLELMLRRAKSGVKLALFNLLAIFPSLLLIAGVTYSRRDELFSPEQSIPQDYFWLVGFAVIVLVGTGFWAVWYKRRKTREIIRLQKILEDLSK